MKRAYFLSALVLTLCIGATAQVATPRESTKQTLTQQVGDASLTIVYSRPNVKGRKVWDGIVPYGKVWRSGANEATIFEVTQDVTINGKPLPAGKYSLHMIPTADEWTLIFNKTWDQWGSFNYDEKQDALRVQTKAVPADFFETMVFGVGDITASTARVFLRWEKLVVPFKVDIGDIHGRVLGQIRTAIESRKPDDFRAVNQGASYVATFKLKDYFEEAIKWIDSSIAAGETFGNLSTKARILKEMGKTADAVAAGEKAVAVGKSSKPPANVNAVANFEATIRDWKSGN